MGQERLIGRWLRSDEDFLGCKTLSTEYGRYKTKNIPIAKITTAAVAKIGTDQWGASSCGNTPGTSVIHHY